MWKVILIKDYNVKHRECYCGTWLRCLIAGIVWRYIPDLTFNGRRFIIVDAK